MIYDDFLKPSVAISSISNSKMFTIGQATLARYFERFIVDLDLLWEVKVAIQSFDVFTWDGTFNTLIQTLQIAPSSIEIINLALLSDFDAISFQLAILRSGFFNGIISARGFSELGLGIDKRFFASYSWLSLVTRKNNDFFRKWSVS